MPETHALPERRAEISPILVRLEPGASQRFTVRIGGRPARAVKWFVNDAPGGSAELGTIGRDGTYRAPAQPPTPNEVHIQAVVEGAANRYVWSTALIGLRLPTYKLLARWGEAGEGDGQFVDPHGIGLDKDGNVLVTDTAPGRVYRFSPEGKLLGHLGEPGSFKGPRDVRVDADGSILVLDGNEPRVREFSPSGKLVREWGEHGSEPGQLSEPHAIALGKDGRIYVADVANNRVDVFDRAGKFLFSWGGAGSGPGQFTAPHGVSVDRNGDVFVVEYYGRCQKFTSDGKLLLTFAQEPGTCHAMASDRWGDVYLMARSPEFGACVMKYNNNGAFVARFRLPRKGEEGFYPKCGAVDESGKLYLTESSSGNVAVDVLAPQ
jgi:streptogramin lyase